MRPYIVSQIKGRSVVIKRSLNNVAHHCNTILYPELNNVHYFKLIYTSDVKLTHSITSAKSGSWLKT
jgi:hypothetical protein